ncbi:MULTISPECIES: hypothetical protein [unclassified Kitasatospora]|uniref:hypothetical protein n=1 Tax=unclassified Kitasatospora TaxID=2633591 RepID=UPI0037FCF821
MAVTVPATSPRTAVPGRRTAAAAVPVLRAGLALPAGLAATALLLAGRRTAAERLQPGPTGVGRRLARLLLGLPLDASALLLFGYAVFNSVRNFGYPLWYLHTDYHQAWGGPTMAGVWAVHAGGWALCLVLLLRWPVRWIARGQQALTARLG